MPSELTTIRIPFRLRDTNGAFVLDTLITNYSFLLLKAGVTFVPATPIILTPGNSLGRHLFTFVGGTEDEYTLYLDYTGVLLHEASIEGAYAFVEKFRTSALPAAIEVVLAAAHGSGQWDATAVASVIADAVWDEVLSGHLTAGTAGAIVSRILQLAEPDVVIDKNTGTITLKDRTTGTVLVTYNVTGIIDSRITDLDG